MKKISLLVLVCMIFSLCFTSCSVLLAKDNTPEHTHSYATEWSFDATNHYNVCSCGSQSNVAKHADDNNDGACDVCAIILDNTHVFDDEWTTDATNHWHAALCGHDVVDAKAAHTADDLGNCTVCGVKVSSPTIADVAAAIELALAQDYAAKSGSVFYSHQYIDEWDEYYTVTNISYFDKAEGYLHVIDLAESTETWYYAIGDSVWSVTSEAGTIGPNADEYSGDNLEGFYFNGAILGYSDDAKAFGVADLLDAFHFMGESALIALESEVVSGEDGDVYTFSFGVPYYAGVYLVKVEFTLDQTSYYADNVYIGVATLEDGVDVTIEYEIDENGDFVLDEDWNRVVKSVSIADGIEPEYNDFYSIEQGDTIAPPVTPEDSVMPSFDLVDAEGNVIGESVEISLGTPVTYVIVPESGSFILDPITATVTDADGNETWSVNAGTWNDGELSLSAYGEGTYVVTVSSAIYSVQFTVNAVAPALESFEVGVYDNAMYDYVASTETTISVNGSFDFKALVNSYAPDGYTYAVTGGTAYSVENVYSNINSFTATEAGTYTLTLTSTADTTKTASVTINVIEGEVKTVESVLKGDYEATFYGTPFYEITFTPFYDGQLFGTLTVVDNNAGTLTGEYQYGYDNGVIEIMDANWNPIDTFTITIDANLNLTFNSNFAMERVEAGTDVEPIDALVDQVFSDGTYYLTFSNYDGEYYAQLADVFMGMPTVGIAFSSYSVGDLNMWDEYELTLVQDVDGSMGTNPLDGYVGYVNSDFTSISFFNPDSGDQVTYTLYNPYA